MTSVIKLYKTVPDFTVRPKGSKIHTPGLAIYVIFIVPLWLEKLSIYVILIVPLWLEKLSIFVILIVPLWLEKLSIYVIYIIPLWLETHTLFIHLCEVYSTPAVGKFIL